MLIDHLNRQLREREAQSLKRQRRITESPCAPHQWMSRDGQPARELLAFCSNDYLGLANHPALIQALADGAKRFGAGSGGCHLISGHSRAHAALEDDLAAWLAPCIPQSQALYFCTGYLSDSERTEAVQLSLALKTMATALKAGATDIAALEAQAMKTLKARGWKPDYIVARHRSDLQAPQPGDLSGKVAAEALLVLGAARIGATRLIDNLEVA